MGSDSVDFCFWEILTTEGPVYLHDFGQGTTCALDGASCTLSVSVPVPRLKQFNGGGYNGLKYDLNYSAEGWSKDFGLGKVSNFNFSLTQNFPVSFTHTDYDGAFSDIFIKGSGGKNFGGSLGIKYSAGVDMNSVNVKIGAGVVLNNSSFTSVIGH